LKELGTVATASLRVVFFETGKRIAHRIEAIEGEVWQPVLVSCEGIDQEAWPTSPALQSLHIERHGADDIAFLVGMAGRSHWSASIRANQAHDRIEFEIACRVAGEPRWLGSKYELSDATGRSPLDIPLRIEVAERTAATIENGIHILAAPSSDGASPRTIAWSYSCRSTSPRYNSADDGDTK
jgi:hypothetical protein